MMATLRCCTKCSHPEEPERPFAPGHSQCIECRKQYHHHRYLINPKVKRGIIQYKLDNSENQRLVIQNRKERVLAHYSNCLPPKCVICGDTRISALQIDHLYGNGNSHRHEIGIKGGDPFYLWLEQQGYPNGFRTLCANDNWREYLKTIEPFSTSSSAIRHRKSQRKIKSICMTALGGKCTICNITELDILTVHHINNDGAEHRRAVSNGFGSTKFYRAINKLKDYAGLECRCYSCNDGDWYEWTY